MNQDDANAEQTSKKIRELKQKVTELEAWNDKIGCTNYGLRQQVAEQAAVIEKLMERLERIACIGNGNEHGNSIGNCLAIEALAIPTDSKQILADWMREQLGEPVAQINVNARKLEFTMPTVIDTPTIVNLPPIPLFKLPECLR